MAPDADTLVFIPAWNEEENLPAVLDELRQRAPRRGRPRRRRRLDRRARRRGQRGRRRGRLVRREPRPARRHRRGLPLRATSRNTRSAGASMRTGSIRRASCGACSSVSARAPATSPSARASPRGDGYDAVPLHAERGPPLRHWRCSAARWRSRCGRPFLDATSGMYAANAKALPVLALPYTSDAPEVAGAPAAARGRVAGRRGAGRHARARQRGVEAAGQEGGDAGVHGDRHALRRRRLRNGSLVADSAAGRRRARLLGAARGELHPICAARLRHAERSPRGARAVVLSGWARRRDRRARPS